MCSMKREPVPATARTKWSPARRRAALERDRYECAEPTCDAKFPGGVGAELDHILPLALGGADELANIQVLCGRHHREKTRFDIGRIAKARRIRRREAGEKRNARPIRSRGFSPKPEGYKHRWGSRR
jgi:5-methylcytosine-specific restriction protein A